MVPSDVTDDNFQHAADAQAESYSSQFCRR